MHKKPTGNIVTEIVQMLKTTTNLRKFRLAPAWNYFAVRNKPYSVVIGYIHVGSSEYLDAIVAFVSD